MSEPTSFTSRFAPRPPHWSALSEYALLPLRVFLGLTFMYAGLQKLSNPNFFNPKSPISIQQSLIASERISPIHALLTPLNHIGKPLGVFIAFAEFAIGLGVFAGLLTRVAAIGGLLLSLNLWLTVSFHASPWFTSADIVYFFAWIPFIIAGSGDRYSVDGFLRRYAAKKERVATSEIVAVPFAQIQATCGHFVTGNCDANHGASCADDICPILGGERAVSATPVRIESLTRRKAMVAASAATGALIFGGAVADSGRLVGNAPAPQTNTLGGTTATTTSTTTSAPVASSSTTLAQSATSTSEATTTTTAAAVKGTLLGKASQVPVGQAAQFTITSSQNPGILVHDKNGKWYAYNAVCPHAGCTVSSYSASTDTLICPCHGSVFNAQTGAVESGPAPRGLKSVTVVEANGNLYLQ